MKFAAYFTRFIIAVFFSVSFYLIKAKIADGERSTATSNSQWSTAAISGGVALCAHAPSNSRHFVCLLCLCAYYIFIFPSNLTI